MPALPLKANARRFRYSLKALLALLTLAALLFALVAKFGLPGLFAIAYCVWLLSPLWVPFCWMYFEARFPREMT